MMKPVLLSLVVVVFLLGIIYLLLPFPSSINNFPGLPYSAQSDLAGDTWQNPNIAGYFSEFTRSGITVFYRNELRDQFLLGKIVPPVTLNRPPEEAYQYVRDQQSSTFLEEYFYPFKGSLFVNGYEPVVESGHPVDFISDNIHYKDQYYLSKTTLRYYPVSRKYSIPIYLAIWLAMFGLYKMSVKAFKNR